MKAKPNNSSELPRRTGWGKKPELKQLVMPTEVHGERFPPLLPVGNTRGRDIEDKRTSSIVVDIQQHQNNQTHRDSLLSQLPYTYTRVPPSYSQ